MSHPETLPGFKNTHELAKAVSELRYDRLQEFLVSLAGQIHEDSQADLKQGRPVLARRLAACSSILNRAATHFQKVWLVCEGHM